MWRRVRFFLLIGGLVQVVATDVVSALDSIRMEQRGGKWFVLHAVEAGETLYGLAKRYQSSVKDIEAHNKSTHILSIGQQLYIPHKGPSDATATAAKNARPAVQPAAERVRLSSTDSRWPSDMLFAKPLRLRFVQEKGIAASIVAAPGKYALHRSAPIGTFVRIQNQKTGHRFIVRVIGRLPDINANKKTLVQLSEEAYADLGSSAASTKVQLTYLRPHK